MARSTRRVRGPTGATAPVDELSSRRRSAFLQPITEDCRQIEKVLDRLVSHCRLARRARRLVASLGRCNACSDVELIQIQPAAYRAQVEDIARSIHGI